MVNIVHKTHSHRIAVAEAVVRVSANQTIEAIVSKQVPKGDVFEMAKAAGFLAVKQTSNVIPDCHPLPIEYCSISYVVEGCRVKIKVEVHTVYKTGVEVEAMHGASVVALTMYDMLKPIDKDIVIEHIQLVEKKGGKSDARKDTSPDFTAAVIVCSDSISKGQKEDRAGKAVIAKLEQCHVIVKEYEVIPDEQDDIINRVKELVASGVHMVILSGGTGLSPRDSTTEALLCIIEKRIPGIEEAMRAYGQARTPYSMLSRSVAGLIENTLVLALPGSTRGAAESMEALFPSVLHIFKVMKGSRHD